MTKGWGWWWHGDGGRTGVSSGGDVGDVSGICKK